MLEEVVELPLVGLAPCNEQVPPFEGGEEEVHGVGAPHPVPGAVRLDYPVAPLVRVGIDDGDTATGQLGEDGGLSHAGHAGDQDPHGKPA